MPTLITDILTGKIMKPLRTKVPELSFFSVDFGKAGSAFAEPVKFGQTVISHLLSAPAAEAFTPGGGLGSTSQNPKDLLTDISVAIDQAAKVTIKLPTADAVRYILDPAFQATLEESAVSLGRYVVAQAIARVTSQNFSQARLSTLAAVEYEHLEDTRAAANKLGMLSPRFVLGETSWINALAKDPVIISGDYHGQLTGADPYRTLVNVAGFSQIREWPNMPTNTVTLGTFTATAANEQLAITGTAPRVGDRVRVSSAGTLPAGLEADTDYYVVSVPSAGVVTISRTVGGSAVNITDAGTGTHTIRRFEALNAVAFERRAIHIAFRPLLDNQELAAALGIPMTSRIIRSTDAETGLSFQWHLWQEANGTNPTGDVYATAVVAFGIRAGREITGAVTPAAQAAGSGQLDYAAIRLVETAAN